jgi:hypothetical protein
VLEQKLKAAVQAARVRLAAQSKKRKGMATQL